MAAVKIGTSGDKSLETSSERKMLRTGGYLCIDIGARISKFDALDAIIAIVTRQASGVPGQTAHLDIGARSEQQLDANSFSRLVISKSDIFFPSLSFKGTFSFRKR